jgi:hypothetical protein
LQGFSDGRFRGESALVYRLADSWPVLAFADALLFSDLGAAYRGFYDDFSHEDMAPDWGVGLRSAFSRGVALTLVVGWGATRVEQWNDEGFIVESTRLIAGVGGGF